MGRPSYIDMDYGKALKWAKKMHDREETIAKKFESSFGGIADNRDDVDMLEIIECALKKRLPVLPKEAPGFVGRCPVCRAVFRDFNKYCYGCGQKLDWGDLDVGN